MIQIRHYLIPGGVVFYLGAAIPFAENEPEELRFFHEEDRTFFIS